MDNNEFYDELISEINVAKGKAKTAKNVKRQFKPKPTSPKPFRDEEINGGFDRHTPLRTGLKFNLPTKSLRGENICK